MFYETGNIKVDRHFARFGSKSYAIDKINSVDVRIENKSGCLWVALLILTVITVLAAIGSPSIKSFLFAAVFAGATVLAYKKRPKPVYHLMLATSSGEVQATTGGDRDTIIDLRRAIEAAITQKGD